MRTQGRFQTEQSKSVFRSILSQQCKTSVESRNSTRMSVGQNGVAVVALVIMPELMGA
jgi:hypothetical protein